MYGLRNLHETGSFATAEVNSLSLLQSDVVLNSLNQDYRGWEVVKILVRTIRSGYLLFQKNNQPMEYATHVIPGSYTSIERFVASEPIRDTVFEGLHGKFEGLSAFADQGLCVVDIVEVGSGTLLTLFKRPVQENQG